jgi:hypothetical protein
MTSVRDLVAHVLLAAALKISTPEWALWLVNSCVQAAGDRKGSGVSS